MGWDQEGAGGGASALDDLTDVDTTTTAPSDGDGLVFDSGSGLWVPAGMATQAELDAHEAAADPHAGYRLESDQIQTGDIADAAVTAAKVAADVATQAELDTHEGAADPHTGYQKESEKGVADGYPSLGSDGLVPQDQLGSGTQDGTRFLRDDGTWSDPSTAHAHAIDDLSDVDLTSVAPSDADVLTYDGTDWGVDVLLYGGDPTGPDTAHGGFPSTTNWHESMTAGSP